MASSEEMRRLMLHAADQLEAVNIGPAFARLEGFVIGTNERSTQTKTLVAATAAVAQAKATLRLVAACMAIDDDPGGAR